MVSEAQHAINLDNAALLFVGRKEDHEIMDPVAAGKLLGKITAHTTGMEGGEVTYKIPVPALEEARSRKDIWDKAAAKGIIAKRGEGADAYYEMPLQLNAGNEMIHNDFVKRLEAVAGIKHADALATAAKYAASSGEGKAR